MSHGKKKKNTMIDIIQPLLEDIDVATEPKNMSKVEAVETLETIIEHLKSRIECLKEEMSSDDDD